MIMLLFLCFILLYLTFKDEEQAVLFKDPVRTAQ